VNFFYYLYISVYEGSSYKGTNSQKYINKNSGSKASFEDWAVKIKAAD
jgi:hypothetical protein